jgi:hypothetical protein
MASFLFPHHPHREKPAAVQCGNNCFYYRQAFGDSKGGHSFFSPVTPRYQSRSAVSPVSGPPFYTPNRIQKQSNDGSAVLECIAPECARRRKMNKKIVGAALGLAFLAASSIASAHVDIAVGVGIPVGVVAPPPAYAAPPVAYGPAPVTVAYDGYGGYGGYGDWRAREWRERREWREHEWRREQWREHEWHERGRWGGY